MVGMDISLEIFLAKFSTTHSITIAKAPELDTDTASSRIFFLSTKFLPLNLTEVFLSFI